MAAEDLIPALQTAVGAFNTTVDGKQTVIDGKVSSGLTARGNATTALNGAKAARDTAGQSLNAAYRDVSSAQANLDHQDLAALAASKAVTAVDVFIYDTSKDSDGGAWRHRCSKLSWFNEPLNTATRGSRREFPAVAVIVAESDGIATYRVTIFDADDPSLPMWMVFSANSDNDLLFPGGGNRWTAVAACNGTMVLTARTAAAGGTQIVSFLEDAGWRLSPFSSATFPKYTGIYRGNIGLRNADAGWAVNSSGKYSALLVDNEANDVAMTVLPDAPVDPATGLPVPTIAIGMDAGASVIHDNGSVFDLSFSSFGATISLSFLDDGRLICVRDAISNGAKYVHVVPLPLTSDRSFTDFEQYSTTTAQGAQLLLKGGQPAFVSNGIPAIGRNGALNLVHSNPQEVARGLVAHITSDHSTGWMPGAIKGAFLSDTDDTDLVGSGELVTNGTFDTDAGWDVSDTGVQIANGRVEHLLTNDYSLIVGNFTLTAGVRYWVGVTANNYINLKSGTWSNGFVQMNGKSGIFITPSVTGLFAIEMYYGGTTVDNLSVRVADEDRSVNANHLTVNGTITRSPVAAGAELVAYSGFSGANFLEQPFNSGLNFGAGDFCIMGWSRFTNLGTWQGLFTRTNRQGATAGSTDTIYARLTGQGQLGFYLWNGSATTSQTISDAVPFGSWVFWVLVRRGGVLQWFVNGVPSGAAVSDGTDVSNITDGTEAFLIGKEYYNGGGFAAGNTSFALFRIGATAPTAEQIAKIYNDEKVLFQENAACTLYGTSDAVTALAHDPDTGLLHVGTSQGRSVFKGLRRVSNTTVAVGTAISAVNGMVVEE